MTLKGVSIEDLANALDEVIALEWVAGQNGSERIVPPPEASDPQTKISVIGHLNFIHPNRIQVLSDRELIYMQGLGKRAYKAALKTLFSDQTRAILIGNGMRPPADWVELANSQGLPLLCSFLGTHQLISHIQYFFDKAFTESISQHGVYLDVMGSGLFLTGSAGIGKSELALELINRGHRLIADDVTEFSRSAPDTLVGHCPHLLRDFMEVRGLGVINIRSMFGDNALRKSKKLSLIIRLEPLSERKNPGIDRLQGSRIKRTLLGVEIDEYTLPVAPGRNLAILVEAAVRNHALFIQGYEAGQDLIERQQRSMEISDDETADR